MEPSYWAVTPAPVRFDKSLTPNAKLLYGEISALANTRGFCWAKNSYFAVLYGVQEKAITDWISQLRKAGHIRVMIEPTETGNERRIYLSEARPLVGENSPHPPKIHYPPTRKFTTPPSENSLPPYIRNNNTVNNTSEYSARPLDFMKSSFPSAYEAFEMQYRKRIAEFDAFENDFNEKAIQEEVKWEQAPMFARLRRLANNWIRFDEQRKAGTMASADLERKSPSRKKIA